MACMYFGVETMALTANIRSKTLFIYILVLLIYVQQICLLFHFPASRVLADNETCCRRSMVRNLIVVHDLVKALRAIWVAIIAVGLQNRCVCVQERQAGVSLFA
jgi:hypothetical protein